MPYANGDAKISIHMKPDRPSLFVDSMHWLCEQAINGLLRLWEWTDRSESSLSANGKGALWE